VYSTVGGAEEVDAISAVLKTNQDVIKHLHFHEKLIENDILWKTPDKKKLVEVFCAVFFIFV
jgi:hypothetical protein